MTDIRRSTEIAAKRTIERRTTLIPTARESEAFVNALLKPPKPGPVLRRAARDYRRKAALQTFTNPSG